MSRQQVFMNYVHPSCLLKQLHSLWSQKQLCDTNVIVDGVTVAKAHRLLLFATSPRLKQQYGDTCISSILEVQLPTGIKIKAVEAFLKYIYEGYIIVTDDIARDLLVIAEYFDNRYLVECCVKFKNGDNGLQETLNSNDLNSCNDITHLRRAAIETGTYHVTVKKVACQVNKRHIREDHAKKNVQGSEDPEKKARRTLYSDPEPVMHVGTVNTPDEDGSDKVSIDSSGHMKKTSKHQHQLKSPSERSQDHEYSESVSYHSEPNKSNSFEDAGDFESGISDISPVKQEVIQTPCHTTTPKNEQSTPPSSHTNSKHAVSILKINALKSDELLEADLPKKIIRRQFDTKSPINRLICQYCGKDFKSKDSFNKHLKSKHEMKALPYKCPHCSKGFYEKAHYEGHLNKHTGERPHKCELCQKGFPYIGTLRKHLMSCAKNPRKVALSCNICGVIASRKDQLRDHIIGKHTGLNPYQCHVCGTRFRWRSSLCKHLQSKSKCPNRGTTIQEKKLQ